MFWSKKPKPKTYRVTLKDDAKVLGPYGSWLATGVEFEAVLDNGRYVLSNGSWLIGFANESDLQTRKEFA